MSEKPSEYLKRTCLICGCHTNQTINIYEPRSGPNIVELIQAKFKFQPLNDDKYLCFSCNNWLINWHSLQALNSNEAENSSSSSAATFRPHMNSSSAMQEKGDDGSQKRTIVNVCRPVAHVKPRQLESVAAQADSRAILAPTTSSSPPGHFDIRQPNRKSSNSRSKIKTLSFIKRTFKTYCAAAAAAASVRPYVAHKSLQKCCVCGRTIVIRTNRNVAVGPRKAFTARCRKCRDVCQWRALHLRSVAKVERRRQIWMQQQQQQQQKLQRHQQQRRHHLLNYNPQTLHQQQQQQQPQQNQNLVNINKNTNSLLPNQSKCLPRPRIDGKIVSMLRRLGTTLSREEVTNAVEEEEMEEVELSETRNNDVTQPNDYKNEEQQRAQQHQFTRQKLPRIMSPAKQKPRWTRPLDDNEILLDFNTAISEVLPFIEQRVEAHQTTESDEKVAEEMRRGRPLNARKALTYEIIDATNGSGDQVSLADNFEDGKEALKETGVVDFAEIENENLYCTNNDNNNNNDSNDQQQWNPLEAFYRGCLPQGLTVSLI